MCSFRVCTFGFLAMVSYVLMFAAIIRFFDQISLANGALAVGAWLSTIGLCYLADRASQRKL